MRKTANNFNFSASFSTLPRIATLFLPLSLLFSKQILIRFAAKLSEIVEFTGKSWESEKELYIYIYLCTM